MVTLQILGCEIAPVPASDMRNYILLANLAIFHMNLVTLLKQRDIDGDPNINHSALIRNTFCSIFLALTTTRKDLDILMLVSADPFWLDGKSGVSSHIWFSSSLSLDLPTSSCPSALDSVPVPPVSLPNMLLRINKKSKWFILGSISPDV